MVEYNHFTYHIEISAERNVGDDHTNHNFPVLQPGYYEKVDWEMKTCTHKNQCKKGGFGGLIEGHEFCLECRGLYLGKICRDHL